jgi:hypothetical protein
MSTVFARLALAALCLLASNAMAYGLQIPAGAIVDLAGGRLSLGGGDIVNAGTLRLGSGEIVDLNDFTTAAGGNTLIAGGILMLTGDWENRGNFVPGTGIVRFRDGANASSSILGSSAFSTLSFVSTAGKVYRFEVGQTQTVATALEIVGTGTPIGIASMLAPQVAFLNLVPGGTQSIANVGVSNVHATGLPLAPGQTNQGGSGNAINWFGQGGIVLPPSQPVVIPANDPLVLGLFALALAAFAASRISRRREGFLRA